MINNTGLLKTIENVMYAGTMGGTYMFDIDNIDLRDYKGLRSQIKENLKPNIDALSEMDDEMCASLGTLLAKNCNQTYSWDMNGYENDTEEVRNMIIDLDEACDFV